MKNQLNSDSVFMIKDIFDQLKNGLGYREYSKS